MSRQEAVEQYGRALRLGRKCHKDCVLRGRYPYPQVLDEIISEAMVAGQVDLGVIEIPTDQITGTKTLGRRFAFAADFMPLLDTDTEFAGKWIDLCEAHLSGEGIRDPIRCYEYLGRFYVQEGNKRVSVLKSFGAPTIPAYVIRMIPVWSADAAVTAYYDFLQSYQLTGLYQVRFSRPGSFPKLQTALGYEADHRWTEEEQRRFIADFARFQSAFEKLGGRDLPVTAADALLVWLKVYGSLDGCTPSELTRSLQAVWPDVRSAASPDPEAVALNTEGSKPPEAGLFSRLFRLRPSSPLRLAFISSHRPEESDWARAHDLGRQYLESVLGDAVSVQVFSGVAPGQEANDAMEAAVAGGAQVIFATTPPLIGACRRAAAEHPGVRVLNCSVSMPYTGVRTYYSRIYEGKFITGAIAGALSADGVIGYVASSPIFGVPAGINAFALGARMTNPRARLKLRWSCVEADAMEALAREGVSLISNRDVPTPDRLREPWGLCQVLPEGGFCSLASPCWHWGRFYVRLVRSILSGAYDALTPGGGPAVNYWWGMASGTVDVITGGALPPGVEALASILRAGVAGGTILPFHTPIRDQSGTLRSDGSRFFSPKEILHMDWLCDSVDGRIPSYEELLPMSRSIVRLQGLHRDAIPPEKEGPIL